MGDNHKRSKTETKICQTCSKPFNNIHYPSREIRRFCSRKCANLVQIKNISGLGTNRKYTKGRQPWQNVSGLALGRLARKGVRGIQPWMNLSGLKLGQGWNKGKPNFSCRGEKHWNWNGGKSKEREGFRKTLEYKIWRHSVFERDNFTCQGCGDRGGRLHADHIEPWSKAPTRRFDITNGRTLCVKCHALTPSYPAGLAKIILGNNSDNLLLPI